MFFCRNASTQTLQKLQSLAKDPNSMCKIEDDSGSTETSTSLDLLLRFQRLLVSKVSAFIVPNRALGH